MGDLGQRGTWDFRDEHGDTEGWGYIRLTRSGKQIITATLHWLLPNLPAVDRDIF